MKNNKIINKCYEILKKKKESYFFLLYVWFISLYVYSNVNCRHPLDEKLNSTFKEYPLKNTFFIVFSIFFCKSIQNYVKWALGGCSRHTFFIVFSTSFFVWVYSKLCRVGICLMWNSILHPMGSYTRHFNKCIKR